MQLLKPYLSALDSNALTEIQAGLFNNVISLTSMFVCLDKRRHILHHVDTQNSQRQPGLQNHANWVLS